MYNVQATLTFNLEDYDAKQAHIRAVKADKAYSALHEITQLLRKYRKYDLPDKLAGLSNQDLIEDLEEEIHKLIQDATINLDEEYA